MRMIEVVEPYTGLGPIVPKVCSSVETIEVVNRRKGFLDKAMCSNTNFKNTQDKNDECHYQLEVMMSEYLKKNSSRTIATTMLKLNDEYNDIITETALQNK